MTRARSPYYHALIAVVAALVAVGLLASMGWLSRLDQLIFDEFVRLRNERESSDHSPSESIAIVAVSNADINKLNRPFPWPRDEQAVIFEKIATQNPSVVAVDLLYTESSSPESDSSLAFQLAGCGKVVSAFYFDDEEGRTHVEGSNLLKNSGNRMSADFETGEWPRYHSPPALPTPTVANGVTMIGHVHSSPDTDGIIRRVPLLIRDDDRLYPSLALQTVLLHWGVEWSQVHLSHNKLSIVGIPNLGKVEIPIDSSGHMILNFIGGESTHFPATDVYSLMESSDKKHIFKDGKIVFVGSLVTGHGDLYATPVNPSMPGLLINALAAEQILTQNFIHTAGLSRTIAFTILVSLVTALCFWWMRPIFGGFISILIIIGSGLTSFYLFTHSSFWLPPAGAMASSLMIAGVMSLGYHLFVTRRHAKTITAFSRYLGPNLGEILSENPEAFDSGPKRKQLTIFFSDIVSYTATSESLESEELIGMLNCYFNEMTEIAFAHGATVSKYMGDGMMIFFNEPIDQADHPIRAIKMAIAMQEAIPKMNAEFAKQALPPLSVRMGIHTGYAHIGNIGSSGFSDFTIIGPAVNLTARIMDLAENGEILVSAKTSTLAAGHFDFENRGEHLFKGVNGAELIFKVRTSK